MKLAVRPNVENLHHCEIVSALNLHFDTFSVVGNEIMSSGVSKPQALLILGNTMTTMSPFLAT
jgi:hypothetical protein